MEKKTAATQRELGAATQEFEAVAFYPTPAEAGNDDMDTTRATFAYIKGGGSGLFVNQLHVAAAEAELQQLVSDGVLDQCFADEEFKSLG